MSRPMLCSAALLVALGCERQAPTGTTSPLVRGVATRGNLALDASPLASPADFTAGAATITFEGLVPSGSNSTSLTTQIYGFTFSTTTVVDPITINNSGGVPIPPPSGTAMAVWFGRGLRLNYPVTEIGAYVSSGFIGTNNTAVPIYGTIHLRAYDADDVEIGSASAQILLATPFNSDLFGWRPPFVGIRASRPIARIGIDENNPPDDSFRSYYFDDLRVYPAPPPPGVSEVIAMIGSLGLPAGTASSLNGKLSNASARIASGQPSAARNILNALINEINAQRGKSIDADDADTLVTLIQNVLAQL